MLLMVLVAKLQESDASISSGETPLPRMLEQWVQDLLRGQLLAFVLCACRHREARIPSLNQSCQIMVQYEQLDPPPHLEMLISLCYAWPIHIYVWSVYTYKYDQINRQR